VQRAYEDRKEEERLLKDRERHRRIWEHEARTRQNHVTLPEPVSETHVTLPKPPDQAQVQPLAPAPRSGQDAVSRALFPVDALRQAATAIQHPKRRRQPDPEA
jgi:hypothetical protein